MQQPSEKYIIKRLSHKIISTTTNQFLVYPHICHNAALLDININAIKQPF